MKVMVLVKATASSESGQMPEPQLMAEMGKFNEELVKAGIMKAGEGLKPSSEAKRVHFRGADRVVTDGPFAETKELIAGYWMWEVGSMEEAVEWVKRCPNPMLEDSDIDIRPVYELDDFAEIDPTGVLRTQEEGLVQQMALQESLQSAKVEPYLLFGGRCEEALEFYERVLGAKVLMKLRFRENPELMPAGMLPEGFEEKIMHAAFTIGKMMVMVSDGCEAEPKLGGFRLALSLPDVGAVDAVFDALAEGGRVDMALGKTFWSERYGTVTDRFGVSWMVMVE